ncbi:MAG TPA: YSC84-related protein [Usitatibacter sp.]|nr:YSC84-related protein [Usitatibacter sp.]
MRSIRQFALVLLPLPALFTIAPSTASDLHEDVVETIAEFKKKDPKIEKFFAGAAGYAVFPSVAKGAIGFGGARGNGELLVGGKAIGKTTLSQVTVGFQLGGQKYSEIIFFEKQAPLDGFKNGDFAFAAEASAVALTSGASANAAYRNGVAVFTMAKGGLMYEASVGGQKFDYKPY